jgi:hypothetical protein
MTPKKSDVRRCMRCNSEITACMGYVYARDFVSGRRPVREHCGRCVEQLYNTVVSMENISWQDYLLSWST